MNEQIKALMGQTLDEKFSGTWSTMDMQDLQKFAERFAELIVKECIDIIEPTSHHKAFAQGYLGDVDGLELLGKKVKQIKQHFGVEE
jgi:hypothetical protein